MQRREFAKTIGGIAGASALGGAALVAGTGGATASAGGTIANPDVATSDDGRIKWVATQTTGRLTWDGFDDPVSAFKIRVYVELHQNGNEVWSGLIHDTGKTDASQGSDWGGPGEEISLEGDYGEGRAGYIASDADWGIIQRNRNHIYNDGYGLPKNPAPASDLYAEEDGSTQETTVVLRSEYALYKSSGAELTGSTGYPDRPEFSSTFKVTVKNQTAGTGSGDADAEGDTGDGATVGV